MQEKQIMIPKTVYETSDGQQFDKEYDAEKWESRLYFENNMTDRYRNVMGTAFCIINSKEESEILETLSINNYVQKGFFTHYLKEDVKFPCMVKLSDDINKSTKMITKNDYDYFKDMAERFQTLCKMYELIQ